MHYYVKKPESSDWDPFSSDSLAESVKKNHVGLDWRIRKHGEPGDQTVEELLRKEASEAQKADTQKHLDRKYYVHKEGKELGPLSHTDVQSGIGARDFSRFDLVWFEGARQWDPLSAVSDFSFAHIPPPVVATSSARRIHIAGVIRDVLIIWLLTALGGFVAGIAAGDTSSVRFIISVAVSNLLLGSAGFAISGCIVGGNRWKHLAVVAVFVWLTSAVNLVFGIGTVITWISSLPFSFIIMGIGGGVSYVFRRN